MKSGYKTADLVINQVTRQVTQNGAKIKLPDLSYRTLISLIQNAPNPVSIDELINQVWGNIEISSETVTQRIALLRKSLNNSSKKIEYISSIRNQGYRWVPEIRENIKETKTKSKIKQISAIIILLLASSLVWFYAFKEAKHKPQANNSIETKSLKPQDEYLTQAWLYLNKHDLKSNQIAIKLFRKSMSETPNNAQAMIGISYALSHQVTKFNQPNILLDEAQKLAQSAIDIDPKNANAWNALAFMHDARGEIDTAINLYEKAITINPKDSSTKGSLAYLYSQKGKLIDAVKLNIEIIGSKQAYLNLQIASTLELLTFESIAEIWYEKADELSPDNVFTTHQHARFYVSNDKNSTAVQLIKSALNREIERPELFVILGIIDWINDDIIKAQVNFKKALKIDPSDFEASIWGFIASNEANSNPSLQQEFEGNWFQESSNWPDSDVFKAIYLAHNKRYEEAILSLESAYIKGYRNDRWLKKLPPFYPILNHPKFVELIQQIQKDVSNQKQLLLKASWLPTSFLDPQNY